MAYEIPISGPLKEGDLRVKKSGVTGVDVKEGMTVPEGHESYFILRQVSDGCSECGCRISLKGYCAGCQSRITPTK